MQTLLLNFRKYSKNTLFVVDSFPQIAQSGRKKNAFLKFPEVIYILKIDWRQGESNLGPLGHELAEPTSKPPSHEAFLLCYLKSQGNPPPQFWQIIQKVPPFVFWEYHRSPNKGEWRALSKNFQNIFFSWLLFLFSMVMKQSFFFVVLIFPTFAAGFVRIIKQNIVTAFWKRRKSRICIFFF